MSVLVQNREVLEWISEEYHGMNGSHVETLQAAPSPLEFSRICHISRPVLIKGYTIPKLRQWSDSYLSGRMNESLISVAVTPDGYADAIASGPDGKKYFVEPHVSQMTMASLLRNLNATGDAGPEAYYLQSQNGNLFSSAYFDQEVEDTQSELHPLRDDVPAEIPWCSEALGRHPDAVNLWIGNGQSVTSIHSDPYENIYHVVRGRKTFLLLPPTEGWCLEERLYPHAIYSRPDASSPLVAVPSPSDTPPIRWSSITHPERPGSLPPQAHPICISVSAGETLYLPAGWWHHVRQSDDITIALNWWYDIEPRGMAWIWLNLLRGIGNVPPANDVDEDVAQDDHRHRTAHPIP
ncbi:Clavaminate synthase-like protein [Artomyces pyxidatus]|uniref:Clavaminate synthase-like protein n=1 Tax=Artomyces pyxidatus TaxID=48021 RepID=A0ACB8TK93_9AGAM|nr:Clavaminate synthase-like protein [Artomyces pyxidatus]